MVIMFVEKHNLSVQTLETFNDFQTSESATNYNDAGLAQVCDTRARGY
jgi:hypothetical protein